MKLIRRMGRLREGLSIASLYGGSTATLMLPLVLAGCSADGLSSEEGVATDEEAFTMWSNARDGLIRKANAGNTVKICLTGTGVTDATRATYRSHIKDAIMA